MEPTTVPKKTRDGNESTMEIHPVNYCFETAVDYRTHFLANTLLIHDKTLKIIDKMAKRIKIQMKPCTFERLTQKQCWVF